MIVPEEPQRLINASNPIIAYVLGTGALLIALNCFLRPRQEYGRFGLPLEQAQPNAKTGNASPLMYLKGSRELTCGLALIVLQYQGNVEAVTTMAAIVSLAGLVDGFVTLAHGGQELRHKVFGHFFAFVFLGAWAALRVYQGVEGSQDRWRDGDVHIWSR